MAKSTDALIEQHMDKARAAAFCEARRRGIEHDYDDLEAAAYHGLCVAAKSYRPGRGTKFWTWAFRQVKWQIISESRRRFRHVHPCWLTVDQENSEGEHMMVQCNPAFSVNLPHPADVADDPAVLLRKHLHGLDARTIRVMEDRYVRGMLLEEIGKPMRISRERVRQIINRGLARLRERMGVTIKKRRKRKAVRK